MRYTYYYSCLIAAHEVIGLCGIFVTFERHICYWHMYGNNVVI